MAEALPNYRTVYSVRGRDNEIFEDYYRSRLRHPRGIRMLSTDTRRNILERDPVVRFDENDYYIDDDDMEEEEDEEEEDDDDDDFLDDFDDDMSPSSQPHVLPYPCNPEMTLECAICFVSKLGRHRLCCNLPVCSTCLVEYLVGQVKSGTVKISCLQTSCSSYIHRDEINFLLPDDLKLRYHRFLVDANQDPHVKTCPRCSHVRSLSPEEVSLISKKHHRSNKYGLQVTCTECSLVWCFLCQAPWHVRMTCREFRAGDKLLKEWSRTYHFDQLNAQKCPKCKIFIQRTTGCDQMTCSRCKTIFCYRCGQRFVGVKLIGNHFSRYSPFGCKYNFLPDRPVARRFIRGAAMSGRLLGGLLLGGLAVGAGAVLLGASVLILPIYGGLRLHKKRRQRRQARMLHLRYLEQRDSPRRSQNQPHVFLAGIPVNPISEEDEEEYVDIDAMSEYFHEGSDEDMHQSRSESRGLGKDTEAFTEIGLHLPDSEVVVVRKDALSQPLASSSGTQDTVIDGSIVVRTRLEEEVDEDGYPRVVAHIVTSPVKKTKDERDDSSSAEANQATFSESSAESDSTSGKQKRGKSSTDASFDPHAPVPPWFHKFSVKRRGEFLEKKLIAGGIVRVGDLPHVKSAGVSVQDRGTQDENNASSSDVSSLVNPLQHATAESEPKDVPSISDAGSSGLRDGLDELDGERSREEINPEQPSDRKLGEERKEEDGKKKDGEWKKDSKGKKKDADGKKEEDGRAREEDCKKKTEDARKHEEGKKREEFSKEEANEEKDLEREDEEKETKGCFTHLIVRKLSSLQAGVADTAAVVKGQPNGVKVMTLNHRKSATWEKRSQRKDARGSNDSRSLNIRALLFHADKFSDRPFHDYEQKDEDRSRENEVTVREGGSEWKDLDERLKSDGTFCLNDLPGEAGSVQPVKSRCTLYVSPCDVVTHL